MAAHPFFKARVHDYMTHEVVSVELQTTFSELERMFARHDFNAFPVLEEGALAGLVTKTDVLKVFVPTSQMPVPIDEQIADLTAEQVMSRETITFSPDAQLAHVLRTVVDFRVKSFPVVDGRCLVGMIARQDVTRAIVRSFAPAAT